MTQIVKLEMLNKKLVSVWGGNEIDCHYELTTTCDNMKNKYRIVGRVMGLNSAEPYLHMVSCEALTNNENTLEVEAIQDLLGW